MTKTEKFGLALVVAAGVLVGLLTYSGVARLMKGTPAAPFVGAAGNLLIEQYDPYVQQNGGINTALGLTASGGQVFSGGQTITGGTTIGSAGTSIAGFNFGNCQIQYNANTIAATSTVTADCVATAGGTVGLLTGVTAGDKVFINQATTSPTANLGLIVQGASASTTAGAITLKLFNGTGTTFTWTAAASSSFQYQALR